MTLSTDESARLVALQSGYDKLISGSKTTSVAWGSTKVDYGAGDVARLKAEIDALLAKSSTSARTRGAIRFRVL